MYALDVDGDLFHRVILQSGSALNPWSVVSKPDFYFRRLFSESAAMFNCTSSHLHPHHHQQQQQVVECLRKLPVDELIGIDLPPVRYRSAVGPVVDGDGVLNEEIPHLMLRQHSAALWPRINLLLGFVSNEGIHSLANTLNVKRFLIFVTFLTFFFIFVTF